MINFHLTLSRQFGGCMKYVRFHLRLRPKDWKFGDHSLVYGYITMFKMYCFGPLAVQWG